MAAIEIGRTVNQATARLGGLHLRAAARRHLAIVLAAVAAGAVTRPFLWPLGTHPSWQAVSRTAILGGGAGLLALAVILVRAWRSRPTPLASARRIDAALALEEVVASGYAFEKDRRDGEVIALARQRALAAVTGIDLRKLLRPARIERTRRARNLLRAAIPLVLGALVFGGLDRLVVARMMRPVTADERAAAAELRKAADALAASADPKDKDDPKLAAAEAARKAAAATERGDRQAAMDALDEMRKAERTAEAREREQAKELRELKDALDGKGDGAAAGKSASAADALAKLGKTDSKDVKQLAERLAKAEAAARASAKATSGEGGGSSSTSNQWQKAAEALAEAREAAARGDQAAAKAALAKAESAVRGLEQKHGQAQMGTLAKASKSASSLDRSLQGGASAPEPGKAMAGEGKDGSGKGKDGNGKPQGNDPGVGQGGDPGDRAPGNVAAERPKVEGDLQARADVREGEKAAGVIDGMGKGGDPRDYKAIFPAYDTAVEDGLREELVPAARRPAVRRYFQSIRPDEHGATR